MRAAVVLTVVAAVGCTAKPTPSRQSQRAASNTEIARAQAVVERVSKGLAKTAWPMARHDPMRTGQSGYVGPDHPSIKWRFETSETVAEPVLGADGTIYVSTADAITALSSNGRIKWRSSAIRPAQSPSVAADGTLYVVTKTNKLLTLRPDGVIRWSLRIISPEGMAAAHVVGPDGTIYVAETEPWGHRPASASPIGALRAIRADGRQKWRVETSAAISPPAIGPDGTIHLDGETLDLRGKKLWGDPGGGQEDLVVGDDGTTYATIDYGDEERADFRVWAIAPGGRRRWQYRHPSTTTVNLRHLAVSSDGTLYVSDSNGYVLALSTQTGRRLWDFHVDGPSISGPSGPTVDAAGTVYVVGGEGFSRYATGFAVGKATLWAIQSDGSLKWSLPLKKGIRYAPTVGPNRTIYVSVSTLVYSGRDEQRYSTTLYAIGDRRARAPE